MTAAALAIGEVELAAALAALVWDPTAAEYVGRDSVLCTTHQQRVALAFAELVLGHDERAESRLRGTTRIPEAVIGEFLMVRGLVECDRGRFADGFRRTLAWHAQVAAEPMNRRYPRYFLCVAALGHAAFAVRRGLVGVHDLPPGNVHCPLELLQT